MGALADKSMLQPSHHWRFRKAEKLVQRNIYRISEMRYVIVLACLLNCAALPEIAAAEALATEVSFPGAVAEGYPKIAEVAGYLVFPTGEAKGQVPAVVILHGSSGIDGRGEFHAEALNAAGIATLEVLMFT